MNDERSIFFELESGRVHALRWGRGKRLLIALHGFSDRARMFALLENFWGERFTVVAIDLPFHGQTEWAAAAFSKADLLGIVTQVLESEKKERFSLLGFSFGARLALAMLPDLAPRLDQLFLLSPDGMKTRGMRAAEWTPMWLRRCLFGLLQRPNWLIALAVMGRKLGLISAFTQAFLNKNLNRPERLRRTFGCWLAMDSFRLRRRQTLLLLEETALPTHIYVGEKDPLLEYVALKNWYGTLPNVQLHVLENEGHALTEGFALAVAEEW